MVKLVDINRLRFDSKTKMHKLMELDVMDNDITKSITTSA